METLFENGGALRFHAEKAAVTSLAASETWPPYIAAGGFARVARGWTPDAAGQSFNPVTEMQENDGERVVSMTFLGSRLVTADASEDGKVTIHDCSMSDGWKRQQTLLAEGSIVSLKASGDYIAVGRQDGKARVWKLVPGEMTYKQLFNPDLAVDNQSLTHLHLEQVQNPDDVLLVIYASGKACVGVWRLSDGKMLHSWGASCSSPDSGAAAQGKLACFRSTLQGGILSLVFWAQGEPSADVHLMHILSGEGGRVPVDHRLEAASKPLCSSFDGATLAVGFEDGAVSVFGRTGWKRWHRGSVGAIKAIGPKEQVLSAGADKAICLWAADGTKLAQIFLDEAVTALSAGSLYAVAGTQRGDVHVVVLSAEVNSESSNIKPDDNGQIKPSTVKLYDPFFDSRWKHGGCAQRASAAPDEFRTFVPSETAQLPDPQAIAAMSLKDNSEEEHYNGNKDSSLASADETVQSHQQGSKFDMGAALKGTKTDDDDEHSNTRTKRNLPEDEGVARSMAKVQLDSNTELIGRKCDNPSCMVREGLGGVVFKRCAACKKVLYCSVHCQRTHWRDAHCKECKTLANASG